MYELNTGNNEMIKPIDEKEYLAWVREVGDRFRKSQVRAATKVNEESLRFYWSVGRDIVLKQYANIYGSGFFAKLSKDLKKQHPEIKSFSVTNLKYMKYFYEVYSNRQQVVDDLNMDLLGQGPVFIVQFFVFRKTEL